MLLSKIEFCKLTPQDVPAIRLHLMSLSADDRYTRFGITMTDERLWQWLHRVDWQMQDCFGAWHPHDLGLIGLLQLSPTDDLKTWEMAVSVHPLLRRQGVGTQLLNTMLMHRRDTQTSLICLHGHAAVIQMAKRFQMTLYPNPNDHTLMLRVGPAPHQTDGNKSRSTSASMC